MTVQAMRPVFVAGGSRGSWASGPVVPVRPRSGAVAELGRQSAGWIVLEPDEVSEPVACQVDVTVSVLAGEVDVLWHEGGDLRVVRCGRFQRVYVRRGVPHCVHNTTTGEAAVLRTRAGGDVELDGEPRREWRSAFTAAVAAGLAG
jgi:mannose-6-phosphate isomerase-like protein (cupin superfamily)